MQQGNDFDYIYVVNIRHLNQGLEVMMADATGK